MTKLHLRYRPLIKKFVRPNRSWLLLLLLLLALPLAIGQNRADLERQKKEQQKEIVYLKKILAETNQKQRQTLDYLSKLKRLITARERLIGTMQNQLHLINLSIDQESDIAMSLESDLAAMKKEYGQLLYYMYKNRNSYDMLSFVFTSGSFNEALRRLKFIQFYTDYRKKQMDFIVKTEASLNVKISELRVKQQEKEAVLAQLAEEKHSLEEDKKNQAALAVKLQKDEDKIRKQLKEKERIAKALDKAISEIIRKEMAAKKVTPSGKRIPANTPENMKLSAEFESNRSRLPWPVQQGYITEPFGQHEHPTLKNIIINNSGIKIRTTAHAHARVIFQGEVRAVIQINGANNSVMVKHGGYFSIYTNLEQVFVKQGDKLQTRQEIGTVADDEDGQPELGLQIWEGSQKLNPEIWIARQ